MMEHSAFCHGWVLTPSGEQFKCSGALVWTIPCPQTQLRAPIGKYIYLILAHEEIRTHL